MPPTRTGVGGVLLPSGSLLALDVGEGAVPRVLLAPIPPASKLVVGAALDNERPDSDPLSGCKDEDVDEERIVSVEVICAELDADLELWLLRVEVANELKFRVAVVKVAERDEILDKEARDAADCEEAELAEALSTELNSLKLKDAVDAVEIILDEPRA